MPSYVHPQQFLTAAEAREKYKPPHTLQAILDHVLRNCSFSHTIYGYEADRMPAAVIDKLIELGYKCALYFDQDKRVECFKIDWEE